jgi:1-acyl-sn-glycerol-3-phosphate acyltransferase
MKLLGMGLQKINYCWRVLATGCSFSLFGVGSLALGLCLFPILTITVANQQKRTSIIRKSVSYSFRFFMYFMHYMGLIDFDIINKEKLLNAKSTLIIANHPSLIDVVAIIAFCPRANCIVKQALWDNFFTRGVVMATGYIPNIDPELLLGKCRDALDNGDALIIFPEGTRTVPGEKPTFQRGVSHVALNLKCTIQCVSISVTPSMLSKGVPWYKVSPSKSSFTVEAKSLLDYQDGFEKDAPRPLAARQLTRYLLQQYC